MTRTEKLWGLMGRWSNGRTFLYYKLGYRKRDLKEWAVEVNGMSWRELHRKGDRVVRVTVTYEVPDDR